MRKQDANIDRHDDNKLASFPNENKKKKNIKKNIYLHYDNLYHHHHHHHIICLNIHTYILIIYITPKIIFNFIKPLIFPL